MKTRISSAGNDASGRARRAGSCAFRPVSAGAFEIRSRAFGARDCGFSLIEVVMVILVISLTLAITYPVLSRGGSSLRLRASGRDLVNLMRYAREKAITEQKGMMVLADREAGRIILSNESGEGVHTLQLPREVRIQRLALEGQEIMQGPMLVHFLSNGSSDNAELVLIADNGAMLRVFTDPITGGARIQLGSGETSP